MRFVFESLDLVERVWHKFIYVPFMRMQLAKHGTHVNIGKNSRGTWKNVYTGNYVSIGANCLLLSTRAKVIIGDYVMFGPNVSVITVNHRIDVQAKECMRLRIRISVTVMIRM